ncbi:MAG: biotin/lipoyl-containing protein, partial [Myxococcota bacterium]
IEEAPSPAVDAPLRAALGQAACAAAAAVNYSGAGTVEFLLAPDGSFYFLEMNTRLQVEHPVTEAITGLDLVEMQIKVAQGEPLTLSQSDVRLDGHAIEARLAADAASPGFVPQAGRILRWIAPTGHGVRVDHGMLPQQDVSPYYDPMVAKVIASGPDRETARRRLVRALSESVLLGLRSNRGLLNRILRSDDFVANRVTTSFLDDRPELADRAPPPLSTRWLAAALVVERFGGDGFRNAHPLRQPIDLLIDGERATVQLTGSPGRLQFGVDAESAHVRLGPSGPARRAEMNGGVVPFSAAWAGDTLYLSVGDQQHSITKWTPQAATAADGGGAEVVAPMAGTVVRVLVSPGDLVHAGDPVCAVEAMKIQSTLRAMVDGAVSDVRCAPGEAVSAGAVLIRIEPEEAS